MKVLLHFIDRIEEFETCKEHVTAPLDLELIYTDPKPFSQIWSLTGKADGMPIYHLRAQK